MSIWFMDAKALEYFHAVSQSGSIFQAATALGVDPSTLTRHIARLEQDVGEKLFHRHGRGMSLTELGRQLASEASKVVAVVENAKRLSAQWVAEGPATISFVAQPTIAQTCFGPIGAALKQRFPKACVRLEEAYAHEIVTKLENGKVDVALLYVPSNGHLSDYDMLLQERLHCVMPASWPAGEEDMDAATVLDLPLILPSTAYGLRSLVAEWAARYGKPLSVPVECDGSACLARRLVQAGLGCTILPFASVCDDVAAKRLRSVPIRGQAALRTVAMATARNRPPLPGQREVLQVARRAIVHLANSGRWPGVDQALAGKITASGLTELSAVGL